MKQMTITSLNANGIRSAASKGLENWLLRTAPDVLCVQELKAQLPDIEKEKLLELAGMKGYFHCAEKKGYSGVAIYTKHEPSEVRVGFDGGEFDAEGRWLELRLTRRSANSPSSAATSPAVRRAMSGRRPSFAIWLRFIRIFNKPRRGASFCSVATSISRTKKST